MDNNEYGFNNMNDDSQNNVNAAENTASTQNADSYNMYSSYSQPVYEASGKSEKKSKKQKGEKKRPCFFIRAVRGVACAVVIGAVAGASCYGAMYAGYINFPVKGNSELTDEELGQIARELNKNYLTARLQRAQHSPMYHQARFHREPRCLTYQT